MIDYSFSVMASIAILTLSGTCQIISSNSTHCTFCMSNHILWQCAHSQSLQNLVTNAFPNVSLISMQVVKEIMAKQSIRQRSATSLYGMH